jgi:hypothetical protein
MIVKSGKEKKKKEKRNLEGIVSSVCGFDIGTVPQMIGTATRFDQLFWGALGLFIGATQMMI